ncbi:hypothetical protein U6B65_00660 [Oscillospiraceae bacterium MB08-C2-2]|nr:hypothetical protein U6B65_00660 [Oscillospiraceae bacterium MB08-C2-2]
MQSIFAHLFEADRKATQMVADAQRYYDETLAEIHTSKERLSQEYRQRSDEHLEKVKATESNLISEGIQEIDNRYAQHTARLDELYEQNHKSWETELFARCTGR